MKTTLPMEEGKLFDVMKDNSGTLCVITDINEPLKYGKYDDTLMECFGLGHLIGKKNVYPFKSLDLVDDENE